ncbi:unnamed protein product [Paramecium primaurelia]|uniref:DNA replication complex GINS protein PSF3 n=1 Tax=Paramecium primaurelia TaxID=5886 RepID=A0A8S1PG10_PARPR|nr:unnamed protein product [Paramecium primaurelia]
MYYNIDDILCEDHLVECRLEVDLYKGSFLDKEAHTEDGNLQRGHVMKLPLWMAKIMSEQEFDGIQLVSVEILEIFEDEFQKALDADPTIMNLKYHSPYFYQLGFKMADMIANDVRLERFRGAVKLRETLIETLKKRSIQVIFQLVQSKLEELNKLTEDEKDNFYLSKKIKLEYEKWEQRLTRRQKNDIPNKKLKQL